MATLTNILRVPLHTFDIISHGRLILKVRWGYLVPDFPTQTHVFFWREIQALRDMGEQMFLVPPGGLHPWPVATNSHYLQ